MQLEEWIIVVGTLAVIAPLVIWMMLPTLKKNPISVLCAGTVPKPRHAKIKPSIYRAGGGFAQWKTGVYGPKDKTFEVPPYIGSQATQVSDEQCTVRSDHRFFTRRVTFGLCVWGLIFALGLAIFLDDYLTYGESRQYCMLDETDPETGFRKSVYAGGGVSGYIEARLCFAKIIVDSDRSVTEKITYLLFSSRYFPFTLMLFSLPGLLYLILKPAPPPIIFDRKRRLVYTHHKGKTYVSDWDTLSVTVVTGNMSMSLGVELFTKDSSGNWQPKWFSLAGYHYHGEFMIDYLWNSGLSWMKRWEGMRSWLILYMDKGPNFVHAPVDRNGLLDYFVPFRKKLPDNMEQQALSLIGDDKAPGDEGFRIKEKNYPPHIEDLYKYWSDWKTYLNQTLPKKRREVAKGVKNG